MDTNNIFPKKHTDQKCIVIAHLKISYLQNDTTRNIFLNDEVNSQVKFLQKQLETWKPIARIMSEICNCQNNLITVINLQENKIMNRLETFKVMF